MILHPYLFTYQYSFTLVLSVAYLEVSERKGLGKKLMCAEDQEEVSVGRTCSILQTIPHFIWIVAGADYKCLFAFSYDK